MEQKKIRHHYVPVCLSKKFCLKDKTLFLYDLKNQKIIKSDPKNAFVENCYHTLEDEVGLKDHNKIENLLMSIEGSGSQAIRNYIKSKGEIDQKTKEELATFWALQYLRVPQRREETEEILKTNIRLTTDICEQSGLIHLPPELKKYGNSINEVSEVVITLPQVTLIGLNTLPGCAPILSNMNWCLVQFTRNSYLALSDNPCPFYSDIKELTYGLGFATPEVEIILPLSFHYCVIASWKPIPKFIKGNKKMLLEINGRTALFAQRFIAYPEESSKLNHFFQKFSIGTPKGEVSVVGNCIIGRSNMPQGKDLRVLYEKCRPLFPKIKNKRAL